MPEFGEGQNIRKLEIAETEESINQLILNAYGVIKDGLPFLKRRRRRIEGFIGNNPKEGQISWKEKNGISRSMMFRVEDPAHPMYMLTTQRPNPQGMPIEGAISYRGGGVFVDQTSPSIIYGEARLDELGQEGNEELKEYWNDAKSVLDVTVQ